MHRTVFLGLFCIMGFAVFAQENINRCDAQGNKQGAWKKYYDNHALRYEGEFKNDVPIGTFRYYHENGKPQAEIHYSESGKKCDAILFNENGVKIAEGVYVAQKKEGEWRYYNEKTTLIRATEFYKNGIPDGKWIIYYDDGKTISELSEWKDGKREGVRSSFFEDGNKKQEMSYQNGKAEGIIKYYHTNGTLRGTGQYKNGQRDGIWTYYDETGKKTLSDIYENGDLIESSDENEE